MRRVLAAAVLTASVASPAHAAHWTVDAVTVTVDLDATKS